MKYPKLGNTELKLSDITFGAWAIGFSSDEAKFIDDKLDQLELEAV